jgi:cation-transporting ATPase 13A3/4/5
VSYENTVLFLLICYQLIFAALVVAVGPPYRKAWYTNVFFDTFTLMLFAISVYLTMAPADALEHILQFQTIPDWYRGMILGLGVAYFGLAWVYEKYMVPLLTKILKKAGPKKQKKIYKSIWGDFGINDA